MHFTQNASRNYTYNSTSSWAINCREKLLVSHVAGFSVYPACWPVLNTDAGLYTNLKIFTVNLNRVYLFVLMLLFESEDVWTLIFQPMVTQLTLYEKLEFQLSIADMAAFPLLYLYENGNQPYEIFEYFPFKSPGEAASNSISSNVDGNMVNVYKLMRAEFWKRRLYPDNLLQKSAWLSLKWLVHRVMNSEDLCLYVLEKRTDPRSCGATKLQQLFLEHKESFHP